MMESYWEWLCSMPDIYRSHIEVLLRCFHTPQGVWEAEEKELAYLKTKGCHWVSRVEAFRERYTPEDILHRNRENRIKFTSRDSCVYPIRLKHFPDRPYGLFYRGSLPAEETRSIGIVGARACTRRGKENAELLGSRIALAGGQVISGAAYGIDGAAQWAAMQSGGKSFAVVGCGVDHYYPPSNERLFEMLAEHGGILSEFPPGTRPKAFHFPVRNRIISGLSDAVVVVEAKKKSGSLITAEYAVEQGRIVMAIPGRPEDSLSEGCNELINQGAGVLLDINLFINDIFTDNEIKQKELSEHISLAPAEKLVYSSLGLHSRNLWELEECTALSLRELSSSLLSLELKGLIRETEQGYYARTI